MRSKQSCVSRRVEVKTRDQLRSEHCVVLVQELIKHLLYMRNQIPGLYEDLEWQTQASYTRPTRSLTQALVLSNLTTQLPLCSVQAQEQERQLQIDKARLELLEHARQPGAALEDGARQLPKKKRRLQTSQKRLTKVVMPKPGSTSMQCGQLTLVNMSCSSCIQPGHYWIALLLSCSNPSSPCTSSLFLGLLPPDHLSCTAWPFQLQVNYDG